MVNGESCNRWLFLNWPSDTKPASSFKEHRVGHIPTGHICLFGLYWLLQLLLPLCHCLDPPQVSIGLRWLLNQPTPSSRPPMHYRSLGSDISATYLAPPLWARNYIVFPIFTLKSSFLLLLLNHNLMFIHNESYAIGSHRKSWQFLNPLASLSLTPTHLHIFLHAYAHTRVTSFLPDLPMGLCCFCHTEQSGYQPCVFMSS